MGSTFGALDGQKVTKMLSKINAKFGIQKGRVGEVMTAKGFPGLVARRFGRKQEKKKERKEERNI